MSRHIQKRPLVSNIRQLKHLEKTSEQIKQEIEEYLESGKKIHIIKFAGDECSALKAMTGVDDL